MNVYDKDKDLKLSGYFKKAIEEKDWLVLLVLFFGILNIILAAVGFLNGIFSAVFGFAVAMLGMIALDKTRNSVAIAGAICASIGTAIGVIYMCSIYLQ